MSQPIVLITFYCQSGETEQLALAAAVGAVQGRALIRLRRLPDMGMVSDNEALLRMRKEYVPPAEKDILGADALIVVAPPDFSESSLQWKPYLDLLRRLADAGSLARKQAATLGVDIKFFNDLGVLTVGNSSGDALALGRAVADAVRVQKQQQEYS
jgi:multimeric flavodoxin WrbA